MIDKVEAALRIQATFPLAHNDLGTAYLQKGNLEKAEEEIREALRQNPDIPLFHSNLGAIYYHQGRYRDAEKEYKKAIGLSGEFALAHYNLGLLYFYVFDQDEEAGDEFREAVRLAPDFAAAHAHLGLILGDNRQLDDAEEHLHTALNLAPDFWLTEMALAYLYAERGDLLDDEILFEDAVKHLDNLIERNSSDIADALDDVYRLRGYLNGRLGNLLKAKADLVKAESIQTDIKTRRNLRRINTSLRERRLPTALIVVSWIFCGMGLIAFCSSYFFFSLGYLSERMFVAMAIGFFVLALLAPFVPLMSKVKIGPVDLEKVASKDVKAEPLMER